VGAFLVECPAEVAVVVVFRVEWPAAAAGVAGVALVADDARSFPASVQQPFNF
jgi:hypothetical protein